MKEAVVASLREDTHKIFFFSGRTIKVRVPPAIELSIIDEILVILFNNNKWFRGF